jgi:site-specific DNA-methyltransferase (cytosine-N4-specific)
MKKLQDNPEKYYSPRLRPSGHDIKRSFDTDNGGAIPSNLLQISNTESNSRYIQLCRAAGVDAHPARFPQKLPAFFIDFLTTEGDTVLDIFGGSNTTGAAAEAARRRWLSFELNRSYLAASAFRFYPETASLTDAGKFYASLMECAEPLHLRKVNQLSFQDISQFTLLE